MFAAIKNDALELVLEYDTSLDATVKGFIFIFIIATSISKTKTLIHSDAKASQTKETDHRVCQNPTCSGPRALLCQTTSSSNSRNTGDKS